MAETAESALRGIDADSQHEEPLQKYRLLALEIRPQKFGFAVFEGPARLLDWGVKSNQGRRFHRRSLFAEKIGFLLKIYAPAALVMRRRISPSRKARKAILRAAKAIKAQSRSKSIKMELVDPRVIRAFFGRHGCATKHQIASLISNWFVELSWRLPRVRRPWHCEGSSAPIFDAATTGLAFFDDIQKQKRQSVIR